MKSYVIRLLDFFDSIEWAKKTYDSGKQYKWDIEYFNGVNGRKETLDDYNLKINTKHKKSNNAFLRPGTVGCFLSHYKLWQRCIELNESICILEHDAIILDSFPEVKFNNILKFVKGPETKPIYLGKWWASGAGYCVTPEGAEKLINFSQIEGAMPADIMLNTGIVDITFYDSIVTVYTHKYSFTRHLNNDRY